MVSHSPTYTGNESSLLVAPSQGGLVGPLQLGGETEGEEGVDEDVIASQWFGATAVALAMYATSKETRSKLFDTKVGSDVFSHALVQFYHSVHFWRHVVTQTPSLSTLMALVDKPDRPGIESMVTSLRQPQSVSSDSEALQRVSNRASAWCGESESDNRTAVVKSADRLLRAGLFDGSLTGMLQS